MHYAALYEPWAFADAGSPTRRVVGSCIGHGAYPFYTETEVGTLPDGVACRWLETKSRFWPATEVRPDVGLNGWCRMSLTRGKDRWNVGLTYLDWVGRERLRANLVREDTRSIRFESAEESELSAIGAGPTWRTVEAGGQSAK